MSRIIVLSLTVMVLFACKQDQFIEFDFTHETTFVIPNGTGISVPVSTLMSNLATGSQSSFEANGTENGNIQNISLTSLELEIVSPSGQEFDFLEDIEVFVSATGLDEVVLGYVFNMQNLVDNTVSLTCSQIDFQEYLKQDNFTLRARTVSDEFNSNDVEIKIKSTFLVNAREN